MDWLNETVEYRGQARAAFVQPDVVAVGDGVARFDRYGHCTIEFAIAETETPGTPSEDSGAVGFDAVELQCESFRIDTPEGTFSAGGRILAVGFPMQGSTMTIIPIVSEFRVRDEASPAAYWVLPLLNLVSGARQGGHGLESHPLHSDATQRRQLPRWMPQGTMIRFEYEDRSAFIERLPDYHDRVGRLKDGADSALVTCIMVGETADQPVTSECIRDWLPADLLLVLSLACGTEVGAPWVETRAHEGQLVSRVHLSLVSPKFKKGHPAIYEEAWVGTGDLLTAASRSGMLGDSHFRAVLKYAIRANSHELSPGECYRNLFLAFEGLAERAGARKILQPSPKCDRELAKFLTPFARAVELLAFDSACCTEEDVALLPRIAGRIANASRIQPSFGEYAVKLMESAGLNDVRVMDEHYSRTPGPGGAKQWARVISKHRATVMHLGFFDFGELEELHEIVATMNHLRDVLLRLLLIELGYDGEYYSPVSPMVNHRTLDWITEDTKVEELGY